MCADSRRLQANAGHACCKMDQARSELSFECLRVKTEILPRFQVANIIFYCTYKSSLRYKIRLIPIMNVINKALQSTRFAGVYSWFIYTLLKCPARVNRFEVFVVFTIISCFPYIWVHVLR